MEKRKTGKKGKERKKEKKRKRKKGQREKGKGEKGKIAAKICEKINGKHLKFLILFVCI